MQDVLLFVPPQTQTSQPLHANCDSPAAVIQAGVTYHGTYQDMHVNLDLALTWSLREESRCQRVVQAAGSDNKGGMSKLTIQCGLKIPNRGRRLLCPDLVERDLRAQTLERKSSHGRWSICRVVESDRKISRREDKRCHGLLFCGQLTFATVFVWGHCCCRMTRTFVGAGAARC